MASLGTLRIATVRFFVLLGSLFAAIGYGQEATLAEPAVRLTLDESNPALAFGRYLASIQERNPFTESGPVAMEIEASLPGLAKRGSMQAVRQTGESERSEYSQIRFDGDSTIKQQVIARYLAAQEQAEELPYSSVAVTPANYKFRYAGSLTTNGSAVYIFEITPKKKRAGLIRGQIWIDSATGIAVRQTGRLVKQPSVLIRRIEVARDTTLQDGLSCRRVTHVAIDIRLIGRAELTIAESPLPNKVQELYNAQDFDFRLKPGSAAIDSGVNLPNVTDGITGQAPDFGALELGSALRSATVAGTFVCLPRPLFWAG